MGVPAAGDGRLIASVDGLELAGRRGQSLRVRLRQGQHSGGGVRGEVTGASRQSLQRLRRWCHERIDFFDGPGVVFSTRTYGREYPQDAKTINGHQRAFDARLRRRWPEVHGVSVIEWQRRGAPHWHDAYRLLGDPIILPPGAEREGPQGGGLWKGPGGPPEAPARESAAMKVEVSGSGLVVRRTAPRRAAGGSERRPMSMAPAHSVQGGLGAEFAQWAAENWVEIAGVNGSPVADRMTHGVRVLDAYGGSGLARYLVKELSKSTQKVSAVSGLRTWRVTNRSAMDRYVNVEDLGLSTRDRGDVEERVLELARATQQPVQIDGERVYAPRTVHLDGLAARWLLEGDRAALDRLRSRRLQG